MTYRYVEDLQREVEIPKNGILSRTLYDEGGVKAMIFGFDAGQELSEHTASRPAIIQILSGGGRLRLGADEVRAGSGTHVHMPAGLPHALRAETPLVMLLLMLPKA